MRAVDCLFYWPFSPAFEAGFIFWYAELAPSMYLCHFYNVRRTTVCIVTSIAFITGYLPIYLFRRPYHPVYIKGWLTQPVHTVLRTIGAIIANVSPLYNLFGPRASTLLNKGESGPSRSLTGWLFLYGTRFWMLFPLALAIYYFFCHGTRRLAMQNDVDDREFKSRIGVYRFDFKEAVFLNNAFKTLLLGLTLFTVVNTVMQSANVFSMKELPTFLLMSLVWLAPILWFYDIYGSIVANIVRYANLRRGHIFYNPYYM